jgi:tRNA pseudouridine-54 N-methylase
MCLVPIKVTCRFMNIPVSGDQKGNCDVICRCLDICMLPIKVTAMYIYVFYRFVNIPASGDQKGNCDVICHCMDMYMSGAHKGNCL